MSIPKDIKLTQNRSWEVNGEGDIATVDGQQGVIQDNVVRLFNESTPNLGGSLTSQFISEFESDVRSTLETSPYVEGPYTVNVIDFENNEVIMNVSTADFEITESFSVDD